MMTSYELFGTLSNLAYYQNFWFSSYIELLVEVIYHAGYILNYHPISTLQVDWNY